MITSIRIDNFKTFNQPVELSLIANNMSKKFFTNYVSVGKTGILKSLGIYGKNNVGKTCVISAIKVIKQILLGKVGIECQPNIFSGNPVISLGVSFVQNGKGYDFDFKYNILTSEYISEKYCCFDFDKPKNKKILLSRDTKTKEFKCENPKVQQILPYLSTNSIALLGINYEFVAGLKKIYTDFANKILIFDDSNYIPLDLTLSVMKNNDQMSEKIAEFLKLADVEIEGFEYDKNKALVFDKDNAKVSIKTVEDPSKVKDVLKLGDKLDYLKLISYHKNQGVPFLIFDSKGTQKVAGMASYIIENLQNGGTLFIDELDSGLHFKLSRAIVAMYNSLQNTKGQLVFTTHDLNLMDCKRMFRKDQIWFADKDENNTYLYSLADFVARDGVRSDADIQNIYKSGVLSNLPEPDLVSLLINGDEDEE